MLLLQDFVQRVLDCTWPIVLYTYNCFAICTVSIMVWQEMAFWLTHMYGAVLHGVSHPVILIHMTTCTSPSPNCTCWESTDCQCKVSCDQVNKMALNWLENPKMACGEACCFSLVFKYVYVTVAQRTYIWYSVQLLHPPVLPYICLSVSPATYSSPVLLK